MNKRSFKEMTQGMTLLEKAEYLWEYYRWTLLAAAFAAVVIAMVLTGVINSRIKIIYSGAAVNLPISEEGNAFLTDGWEEILGAEKREEVQLFSTSFQDLQTATDVEYNSATAFQVVLMITAGDYDYVIMDEAALNYYKNHSVFTALDEIFPEEVMEEFKDGIVWHQPEDGQEFPLAFDVTQSAFAQKYIAQGTKVYIAFPGNTGRTQINVEFLEYLMNAE